MTPIAYQCRLRAGCSRALVDHLGGPVRRRPVRDVDVAGDPADIGCAPPASCGLVTNPHGGSVPAARPTKRTSIMEPDGILWRRRMEYRWSKYRWRPEVRIHRRRLNAFVVEQAGDLGDRCRARGFRPYRRCASMKDADGMRRLTSGCGVQKCGTSGYVTTHDGFAGGAKNGVHRR